MARSLRMFIWLNHRVLLTSNQPTFVCKLHKAIYGLKQAPRAWNDTLKATLQSWGFVNSKSDTSLYIFRMGTTLILLLVYVDEFVITGSDRSVIDRFVNSLDSSFALKGSWPIKLFSWYSITLSSL